MILPPRIVSSLSPGTTTVNAAPPSSSLPPVVLHFDINETIVLGDEAGDDTREDSIHKLLCKSAWVKINNKEDVSTTNEDTSNMIPTHWWDGTELSLSNNNYDDITTPPPLYTGWEWPPQCCPYYRTKFKQKYAKRFIEYHGWIYKPLYDRIQKELEHSHLPPELSHILPAFFRTLDKLSKSNNSIKIVFRTFGTDLLNMVDAMQLFACGQHPDYPNFKDERFLLKRSDLVRGRWCKSEDDETTTTTTTTYSYNLYSYDNDNTLIASGDEAVLDWIESRSICGIQDDYEFWSSHDCEPWAGKPVWATTTSSRDFQHILLDDNIHNLAHDSIASVRIQQEHESDSSFRTLSGEEIQNSMQGIHLIRVPTIEPILNPNWFLEQIDQARRRYAAAGSVDVECDEPN